jgi:hypothetical protein
MEEIARPMKATIQIRSNYIIPVAIGHPHNQAITRDSGVIYKNINGAVAVQNSSTRIGNILHRRDVHCHMFRRKSTVAQFRGQFATTPIGLTHTNHVSAAMGKRHGYCPPDSTASASY